MSLKQPRTCQQLLHSSQGGRDHSPAADTAHMRQPGTLPCSRLAAMVFPGFPSTGSSKRGSPRGKSLSFLLPVPAKSQARLPFPVLWQHRGPAAALASCPGRCIPQLGGVSANLLLLLETLQSRAGVQVLPLPPRAGSGLWPHTDPGRWLISSQLEVKGCQSSSQAVRSSARGHLTHSASIWY